MGVSWVNLMNYQLFTKLNPSKLVAQDIDLLADLFIHQTFFNKIFIHPLSPNVITAKFFLYMIYENKLLKLLLAFDKVFPVS